MKMKNIKEIIYFSIIDIKNINRINFNENREEYAHKLPINATVIIPVYNCEKTINYSILSIQKQNLTNLEIILILNYFLKYFISSI